MSVPTKIEYQRSIILNKDQNKWNKFEKNVET